MNDSWEHILLSYLHDPPDKPLSIRGHESRAARYATAAFGRTVEKKTVHDDTRTEDILASIAERVPFPHAGERGERAVGPDAEGRLEIRHPLSGHGRKLPAAVIDEATVVRAIERSVGDAKDDDDRERMVRLWRFLRDDLENEIPGSSAFPADTRLPDATIWNHLDITSGLRAALAGDHGVAFLSFALSPVQGFIAASRSLRDLWGGSYILAWLTAKAMEPVLDAVGPMGFVIPSLRGMPLIDHWLKESTEIDPDRLMLSEEQLRTPSLPNRFLAIVPAGENGTAAAALARECENACRGAWTAMADDVRKMLDFKSAPLMNEGSWDKLWDEQIDTWFDMVAVAVPERECNDERLGKLIAGSSFEAAFPDAGRIRAMGRAIPDDHWAGRNPKHRSIQTGRWQGMVELAGRSLAARRAVRSVPGLSSKERVPQKCSLLGTYEQMGPADLDDSREFWDGMAGIDILGVHIRSRERFSAVALTKRFAWPAHLAPQLGLDERFRYPDTATVAAAEWLERERPDVINPDEYWRRDGTWSGQWLHWPTPMPPSGDRDEAPIPKDLWKLLQNAKKELGPPPAYYAILNLDGDHMGKWLKGEKSPTLGELIHPAMKEYFDGLKNESAAVERGLNAKRPVGPALHAAISEALTNFALEVVPHVVKVHKGTLVYSGGDDVLALLPTRTAIACARELNLGFQGSPEEIATRDEKNGELVRRPANGGADPGYYRLDDGRTLLMMGPKASTSAGIAVVHYKEDLRYALDQARQAEKLAKQSGRKSLAIRVCRRSGEHVGSVLPWDKVPVFEAWVQSFIAGASDRWAYDARDVHCVLGENWEMFRAEIFRLMKHRLPRPREKDSLEAGLRPDEFARDAEDLMEAMRTAAKKRRKNRLDPDAGIDPEWDHEQEATAQLITSVQSASFLARGRDE